MPVHQHDSRQRGFTLMEVMVALAILSVSLVGLMHVFSSLLAGIGKSELYAEGTLVAREVLERNLIEKNLEEGIYTGEVNEMFQWTLVVTRRETALDLQEGQAVMQESQGHLPIDWLEDDSPLEMYEIVVTVVWPETPYPGQIQLATLRGIVNMEAEDAEEQLE
ncbi:prepilin-type N-terminal cleavage/methylation domain-containing protein [bacterium]|nr:prepilin-type N-terminal cleavage/methylation domain-containing protein [candidate division CSSED10-310 bacterium]